MTKDEILQALRLTAMGRAGHPLQEQLAEKLAEVFAGEMCPNKSRGECDSHWDVVNMADLQARREQLRAEGKLPPEYEPPVTEYVEPLPPLTAPKKRNKKAD